MNSLTRDDEGSFCAVSEPSARERTAKILKVLREPELALPTANMTALGLDAWACVLGRRRGEPVSAASIHRYMEALANNLPLRQTLMTAARALHASGVLAIVYKGQDYLERVYGDLGARAMADVDLLVRERDLASAERALIGAGFTPDRECRLMHERKFCKDGVAIDLHHALLQPARMRITHDELFERAVPSRLAPGLLAFERTDALLVHCINQTVKGYCLPASSYIELQALLGGAERDEAIARATRYGMLSALYTSLTAIGRLGHPFALRWAARLPMSSRRKATLEAVVVRFGLASIARETPARATMLALKATLIDDALAVLRFVPQWTYWQLPGTAPRALSAPAPARGDPQRILR